MKALITAANVTIRSIASFFALSHHKKKQQICSLFKCNLRTINADEEECVIHSDKTTFKRRKEISIRVWLFANISKSRNPASISH